MNDVRKIVITGMGMVTAFGVGTLTTWSGVRAGGSAVRQLDIRGPGGKAFMGAPVALDLSSSQDPVVQLARISAAEAMTQSGFDPQHVPPDRRACTFSTSKGALHTLLAEHRRFQKGEGVSPDLFQRVNPAAAAGTLSADFDFRGPSVSTVAACATGVHALMHACELLLADRADVVLTGAADASAVEPLLWSYEQMGVLSHHAGEPKCAVKPFDRDRDGFVVGEGAAAFVCETAEQAHRRGATALVELAGWARGGDAYHLTHLAETESQIATVLTLALKRAGVLPEELDYVNAHGTATEQNDVLETRALHRALGTSACRVAVSSTKAATGHLLGAAGAVESALTVLTLRDGFLPPTLNLKNPDPRCDLDYVPLTGRPRTIQHAACISAGFGGQIGVVVFRKTG